MFTICLRRHGQVIQFANQVIRFDVSAERRFPGWKKNNFRDVPDIYYIGFSNGCTRSISGWCLSGGSSNFTFMDIRNKNVLLEDIKISQDIRNQGKYLRTYREFQILNRSFETCYRYSYIPVLKLFNISCQSISISGLIKYHDKLGISLVLMFSVGIFVFLVVEIVAYPLAAKIHEVSKDFLDEHSRMLNNPKLRREERLEFKKMIRSCWPLSVHVLSCYIIKRATPLIVLVIVFNITMNFILIA
ncbi:unnamed protein product [Allacma fusca]|uniref:Uncharacterized protein n=1 Tax=Allacma fusca TaxID=39272 RepID=A0A8J2NQY5_9HEXA|nr:unnamed protein product [Allacma fusca]